MKRFTKKLPALLSLALALGLVATAGCRVAQVQQPPSAAPPSAGEGGERPAPNIVVLFVDDLGYGDIGPFGHPTIRTPHLDAMASQGMKLTQFYSASSVCTPSRAALLTGRLPVRSGTTSDVERVFFPDSKNGLPLDEVTVAEALAENGYDTYHIGKWHLGHRPQFLPTNQGFDAFYGVPYSNDMDRRWGTAPPDADGHDHPEIGWFNVPLMRDTTVIERPANQHTLNQRYAAEAVQYIEAHAEEDRDPFFLYFAHSSPHVPLFASAAFEGVSRRGLYGDVVEEIDWTVGQVLRALRETGQAENTLVVFTSDNGPWLPFGEKGGSAGLLRGGKGSTWEGGVRVPTVAWWPGTIEAGAVSPAVTSTLDLLPTALALAKAAPPADGRIIDGQSLVPVLKGADDSGHASLFFYRGERLYAVRLGPWKAHFVTQAGYGDEPEEHDDPVLFHLEHDPAEQYDVASDHPEVIAAVRQAVRAHRARLERGEDQLAERSEQYFMR